MLDQKRAPIYGAFLVVQIQRVAAAQIDAPCRFRATCKIRQAALVRGSRELQHTAVHFPAQEIVTLAVGNRLYSPPSCSCAFWNSSFDTSGSSSSGCPFVKAVIHFTLTPDIS